jgi:Secretion system C-terminal sorting domain
MLKSIMKNLSLTAALLFITFFTFSQGAYTSQNNKKNNWETASIWTKQFPSMAAAPPGPSNVAGSFVVNIYGVVTRNGNLSFTGGSTLNVYDTLIIKGNLTVASSVVVHPGGVLIITGDFTSTSSGGNKLINNGNVITVGNFSHSGGAITTNDRFYSFDTTPTFNWGASMDGVGYNGSNTAAMGNELKPHSTLNSVNPSLSNYVNNILGVMPIKLISFIGSVENNQVVLHWVTASEEGFDHFEIERASHDLVFKKIAQVNGAGYNTEDEHPYSITDSNPVIGGNYYRLKSVDLDGSYEYSGVVVGTLESSKSVSVYPNPSTGDFVNVASNFELTENTQITIFTYEGIMVQQNQLTERDSRIDFVNHLASGVYILKYTSGSYSQTIRFSVK